MSGRDYGSRSDRNHEYNYGQGYRVSSSRGHQYPLYFDDNYYPNIQAPFYADPYHNAVADYTQQSEPLPPKQQPTAAPAEPSPDYISASLKPSTTSPLVASRKLLIVDLNGTLLFRSPVKRKPRPAPHERASLAAPAAEQHQDHQNPRLRPVHTRPYMGEFRSYLFAPQTRAWLDTMVWSSAQPHSVDDMVEKCFGPAKDQLVAVWARDTLGLSSSEYHQKSITTKDLTKPWSQLPLLTSDRTTPSSHSALTTLLLDDSPRKARLQPWNHVCIADYASEMRARDLEAFNAERARRMRAAVALGGEGAERGAGVEGEKRKRRHRNKAKAVVDSRDPSLEPPHPRYDETLLGVIGVLDAAKRESNVAGWIRAGGLRGPGSKPPEDGEGLQGRAGDVVGGDGNSAEEKRQRGVDDRTSSPVPELWFEHGPTMEYWAGRGRAALAELGIEVGAGIER